MIFDKWDDDGNGRLDLEQLISVFREVFSPDLSIEEVEGVSGAWGVGALERMDFMDFLCVFSRFLRIHEQDWSLLAGFYSVMGKRFCTESDHLRAKDLAERSLGRISHSHAQEMLWAVDWRRDGEGEGKTLPFIDLIAAVLMNVDLNPGKLPPSAKNTGNTDTEVVGFNSDAKGKDTDEVPKYVYLHRGSDAYSLRRLVPEVQFKEDPTLLDVDGFIQDLRDVATSYVGSRKSHIVDLGDSMFDGGSILDQMMAKRQQILAANAQAERMSATDTMPHHMDSERELKRQRTRLHGVRAQIYGLCELPASSAAAQYLSVFMGAMICLSVLVLFAEPSISPPCEAMLEEEEKVWRVLEMFFCIVFGAEFIIRLSVANAIGDNTVVDFLKTPSNICDFVALLPCLVEIILTSTKDGLRLLRTARLMKLVRLLRVSRVMRLSKLAKHGSGFAELAGPVAMVFTVIWGIYLMSIEEESDECSI